MDIKTFSFRSWILFFVVCFLFGFTMYGCQKELGAIGDSCLYSSDCDQQLRCLSGRCGIGGVENAPCKQTSECETGLTCTKGYCKFEGPPCESDKECKGEKKCSGKKCLVPGAKYSPCLDTNGCQSSLVCSFEGRCSEKGKPGTRGEKAACKKKEDCQRGLSCTDDFCRKGGQEGSSCKNTQDCEGELVCHNEGRCTGKGKEGTFGIDDSCSKLKDCQAGLACSNTGVCAPTGAARKGEPCIGTQTCIAGLICAQVKDKTEGVCASPNDPGTKQSGENCTKQEECAAGMICSYDGTCKILRPFKGVSCEATEKDDGPFRLFFEVPRAKKPVVEFFRLPYPNDIRKKNDGHLDLSGFPSPGKLLGEDLIGKYVSLAEKELKGWGPNQVVVVRTSQKMDFGTLDLYGPKPAVVFINLDTGSRQSISISYHSQRTPYICPNYLLVRPGTKHPLAHGQTYAVIFTSMIKNYKGRGIVRDADFEAIMNDTAPADPTLAKAHERYKKLRTWLAGNVGSGKWPAPSDVVGAAVFTTQDPDAALGKLREVIHKQDKPTIKKLTLCKDGVTSPCESENSVASRKCEKENDDFYELHGIVSVPIFQKGDSPYQKEGGNLDYEDDGTPKVVKKQDVCVAITVPKSKAPDKGWPVLLYAHGTGANFRSHIANGTAKRLIDVDSDQTKVSFVTVGFDQVVHGPRRNGVPVHPNFLFFNFRNAEASLGNTAQNAADLFTMTRWIKEFALDAKDSPTQEAIAFNKDKIAFLGHSQGGFAGPIFLAYEPDVKAAVLSGAGGKLNLSLTNKTSPVNIAAGIQALVGSPKVNENHPVVDLIQLYFERVDPVNYGKLLLDKPTAGVSPKHLLQTYGIGDTYTPKPSILGLAYSLRVEHAGPAHEEIKSFSDKSLELPAKGNKERGKDKYSAFFTQYKPGEDSDGHFVLFKNTDAIRHFSNFLASFVSDKDGIPSLVK